MEVLLRLKGVSQAQSVALMNATWPNCPKACLDGLVELKSMDLHDGKGQINLKIEIERDLFARGSDKVPVFREDVDKLWDLLGILPQRKAERDVAMLNSLLEEAMKLAGALRSDITGSIKDHTPGFYLNTALMQVETSLITAIRAVEKMPR